MAGDDLADFRLTWEPLADYMDGCVDDVNVLVYAHRYLVSGIDLEMVDDGLKRGISRRRILNYLESMAKSFDEGRG